jgi:hypothetical protein
VGLLVVVDCGLLLGAHVMHNICGRSPTMHVHGVAVHLHLSSHSMTIVSCRLS